MSPADLPRSHVRLADPDTIGAMRLADPARISMPDTTKLFTDTISSFGVNNTIGAMRLADPARLFVMPSAHTVFPPSPIDSAARVATSRGVAAAGSMLVEAASAGSQEMALEIVRWVDKLPDRDTRAVLVKFAAVILGLVSAAVVYDDMGIGAASMPLIWAIYYLLDLGNALMDKAQR